MAVPLEQVVKQLEDSGIVAAGKLENVVPPKAHPTSVEELVAELVKADHLTRFQAQHVNAGKTKSLILGGYTILDKIGAGGMGQVFKAQHRRMDRTVAIKMLPPAMTKDAAAAARFEREVRAAAKLNHTNIVTAYDADQANGAHFLVMEYVEGKDLSALVKKNGPFSVAKTLNYILQAARGLEFAHKKGVVHRDIKPANLLLDNEGTVKILDMGLARIEGDGPAQAELTGTGTVMGTVDYMAPEQALSTKNADAKADIYSLGCSLYYLVAGKPTYDGDTLMAKLMAHSGQPIPALRDVQPQVPEQLEAVFKKMVAKKIEDRYQTMTEVVAELERCQALLTAAASSSTSVWKAPATDQSSEMSLLMQHQKLARIDNSADPFAAPEPQPKPRSRKKGGPPWKNTKLLVGASAAGFLFVLLGVIVIFRNPKGEEVGRMELAPGHTAEVRNLPSPLAGEGSAVRGAAPWNTPAFQQWMKTVAALPAEKQVDAVSKKLMELNPGFDGVVMGRDGNSRPTIENGVVTVFGFVTDNVTDISPVRALVALKVLNCSGSVGRGNGKLSDLSPLQGMALTRLMCSDTHVSALSSLQGMKLTKLACARTQVADLSPLAGMPLIDVICNGSQVADLSPLMNMPALGIFAGQATKVTPAAVAALHKALPNCKIEWDGAGKPAAGSGQQAAEEKPWETPAFQQWMKTVAAMPAEKQIETVSKKLMELNPRFDGKVKHSIDNRTVTHLDFITDNVTDISPVGALAGLQVLTCSGSQPGMGKLSDLSPIEGMKLTWLSCSWTKLSDLSPLQGMPLTYLRCIGTQVSDLSPLQGMPLAELRCASTQVSDLSALKGIPTLAVLNLQYTKVTPAQVAALQKALPNCKIEWDGQGKK